MGVPLFADVAGCDACCASSSCWLRVAGPRPVAFSQCGRRRASRPPNFIMSHSRRDLALCLRPFLVVPRYTLHTSGTPIPRNNQLAAPHLSFTLRTSGTPHPTYFVCYLGVPRYMLHTNGTILPFRPFLWLLFQLFFRGITLHVTTAPLISRKIQLAAHQLVTTAPSITRLFRLFLRVPRYTYQRYPPQ